MDASVDRLHAGKGVHLGAELFEEPTHARRLFVGVGRERHAADEDVLGLEAQVDALQVAEAAQQQAGAHQQYERRRDLRDHEGAVQAAAPLSLAGANAVLDRLLQVGARAADRRSEAEDHDGRERDAEREQQHGRVEGDLLEVGHAVHDQSAERPDAPEGERQADGAARGGE